MNLCTARQAIERFVDPGDTVVIAPGLGEPRSLVAALADQAERLHGCRVLSGLLLGDFPFLSDDALAHLRYDTWHLMSESRRRYAEGRVGFIPLRGSRVVDTLADIGVDVLLCNVSPADESGNHSFGASVSYPLSVARFARKVIAEVHEEFPFTCGDTVLPAGGFTALAQPEQSLPTYRESELTFEARQIAAFINTLIPDGATLQVGLGAVSEALLVALLEEGPGRLGGLWGMATETAVAALEREIVAVRKDGGARLIGGELMGSNGLLRYCHRNPSVELYPSAKILAPSAVAAIPRFVSVNTALQVDLHGNVNAEMLSGRQVSGAGGSVDFVEGAAQSEGGMSIIAIASTAGDGKYSRIVRNLEPGVPTVTTRHSVQLVVTEYGIADLRGKTLAERAEALISIAHPLHRDGLCEPASIDLETNGSWTTKTSSLS